MDYTKARYQIEKIDTILVVEDEKVTSRTICKRLQKEAFTTRTASNGAEAIAFLKQNANCLLVLDYHLPDMTADEIVRELAQRDFQVPFIVLTGQGNEKLAVKMMKLGARDYVVKEKGFGDLLVSTVNQVISQVETEKRLQAAEEALKQSARGYRMLIDNMHDGIVIVNPEKIVKFVNSTAEKILGKPKESLIETPFVHSVTENETEISINHPNGSKTIASLRIFESEWEGQKAFVVTIHDQTASKQAEENLRKTHSETEQLLSSVSSILIGVGIGEKIMRWNSAAEETFGIKASDVLGQSLVNSSINWSWLEVLQAIEEFRDKKTATRLSELPYTRPDGRQGFLNVSINPFFDDDFIEAGFLLLADEVTERKVLESQLSQAQKLESIGQLAAGIAHEINTPIQYVGDNTRFLDDAFKDLNNLLDKNLWLLEAAKKGETSDSLIVAIENEIKNTDLDYLVEEIPVAIRQSLEGVERVAKIVRAMKEFSHPGSEEKNPTDINKALENTITVARSEWKYVADVETKFDPALPLVPCFPGELNQVFLNIIVNAAHAISDVVQNEAGKIGKITVSTQSNDNDIEIRIADTGAGIPKDIQSKVFDPFFTSKEVGKGTGQGLTISHNVVVDKHGGSLTFESQEGIGTTFIIRLPIDSSYIQKEVKSQ